MNEIKELLSFWKHYSIYGVCTIYAYCSIQFSIGILPIPVSHYETTTNLPLIEDHLWNAQNIDNVAICLTLLKRHELATKFVFQKSRIWSQVFLSFFDLQESIIVSEIALDDATLRPVCVTLCLAVSDFQ